MKLGDSLLLFCAAGYVSRIAWQRGHGTAVVLIWFVSYVLDVLHNWLENKRANELYTLLGKEKTA